jgi:hypothetical protein
LCKRIVEFHGGTIWVTSRPDEGAVFSFRLPASAADSASVQGVTRPDRVLSLVHRGAAIGSDEPFNL